MKLSKRFWAIALVIFIFLGDQILKIWIKTHLSLYKDIHITHWFHICFVENNGMTMGIEVTAKLFLSIFRIIVSIGIIYYFCEIVKRNFESGYVFCISMILAGVIGNIIDSVFYGVIFSDSTPQIISTLFPSKGYATWFYGKVVDMFYFPFFKFILPIWIPFIGGNEVMFFRYIFNLADASICIGIIILLLFYRNVFFMSFDKNFRILGKEKTKKINE